MKFSSVTITIFHPFIPEDLTSFTHNAIIDKIDSMCLFKSLAYRSTELSSYCSATMRKG